MSDSTSISFGSYRQLVFDIAHDVRRLCDAADQVGSAEAHVLNDLLRLIESNHFAVAVVGEFKRGKSTFINALLGEEVLPADIEPCSATLNRVTYGLKPGARVIFHPESPDQTERIEDVPIERLAEYVTKLTPESTTMSLKVKEAIISYPVQFCKNNVDIIDTPGLNDDIVMTEVTFAALASVHAAIMVVMATAPFGETESTFLRQVLLKEHTSVMFVVTAIDQIRRATDQERVLKAIKTRILQSIEQYAAEMYSKDTPEYANYLRRMANPMVFGVSGYDALQARRGRDADLFAASGFAAFESALEQFLTRERGARSLADLLERVIRSGEKIAQCAADKQSTESQSVKRAATAAREAIERQQAIRQRCDQGLRMVDGAAEAARATVSPFLDTLEMSLKIAAADVIGTAGITTEEITAARKAALGRVVDNTGQNLLNKLPPGQMQDTGKKYAGKVARWLGGQPADVRQSVDIPVVDVHQVVTPAEARTKLVEALPTAVNTALDQVWRKLAGNIHSEIQRTLQGEYERIQKLAADLDQDMQQTAQLTGAPALLTETTHSTLSAALIALPTTSGLWAAMDGQQLRVGPALANVLPILRTIAALVIANVGVMLLSSSTVDQFKSGFIRSMSEQITQHVKARLEEIRRLLDQDIVLAFETLTGISRHIFEEALGRYGRLVANVERMQERENVITDIELRNLAQLQSKVEEICTKARSRVNDLLLL